MVLQNFQIPGDPNKRGIIYNHKVAQLGPKLTFLNASKTVSAFFFVFEAFKSINPGPSYNTLKL